MLRKTAETVLGVTFGKRKEDKETWWWNDKVQESIKEKKKAKKARDKIRDENTKKICRDSCMPNAWLRHARLMLCFIGRAPLLMIFIL